MGNYCIYLTQEKGQKFKGCKINISPSLVKQWLVYINKYQLLM